MTESLFPTQIELLSPARDLKTGIEAINCGADAVYIGAEAFGARHAAGNSVEDIALLVKHAHIYGAKVYVTVNTILFDNELEKVKEMVLKLKAAGVDALITQDTALISMALPIPLHASTQMDVSSSQKVRQLRDWGFQQVVLARELGLSEIAKIHRDNPEVKLEAFIHGALCVSYSGRCYASWHCFKRSANRGECAQFCRLAFDLEDADGHALIHNRHLLSLKDMNRHDYLEKMMDAGVCSFKIEGRLKDAAYVKNVTAFYRQQIDTILRRRKGDYVRSSFGQSHIPFSPDVRKSFNRGFTPYFIDGRQDGLVNIHTPKVVGEKVGTVKEIRRGFIVVAGCSTFHNGDGLCFFTHEGVLKGFRVNRVDNNKIFPFGDTKGLELRATLYRNHDTNFEDTLSRPVPTRTIPISITLSAVPQGFLLAATKSVFHSYTEQDLRLTVEGESQPEYPSANNRCELLFDAEKQVARTPQVATIESELRKTGGTPFTVEDVCVRFDKDYFIPKSILSKWRRMLLDKMTEKCLTDEDNLGTSTKVAPTETIPPASSIPFTANISNSLAKDFYLHKGTATIAPAFELHEPEGRVAIMTCKYCLRYAFGQCLKNKKCPDAIPLSHKLPRQLYLRINGAESNMKSSERFPLEFDCSKCQMKVMKEK